MKTIEVSGRASVTVAAFNPHGWLSLDATTEYDSDRILIPIRLSRELAASILEEAGEVELAKMVREKVGT